MTLSSNSVWEVTSLPSWLTISPMSGTGNAVIAVNWTANDSTYRSGDIVFSTCGGGVQSILTFNQDGLLKSSLIPVSKQELIINKSFPENRFYPNPFSYELNIELVKKEGESLSLIIFDIKGSIIKKIDHELAEGLNTIVWDATDGFGRKVNPGIYLITLQSEMRRDIYKVIYQGN